MWPDKESFQPKWQPPRDKFSAWRYAFVQRKDNPRAYHYDKPAAQAGCLDLNLLLLDGQAVAFNYNYQYRGHVSSLRLGFDEQYGQQGVGTVLTRRMLKDTFVETNHEAFCSVLFIRP